MFAYPPQAGFFAQGFFHHRGTVNESPITEPANLVLNSLGQLLQATTHQFVIVTAQGITRDIGFLGMIQQLFEIDGFIRQVIESYADNTQGIGYQIGRATAFVPVSCHPLHVTLKLFRQPLLQMRFIVRQIGIGDGGLLKTQLATPVLDLFGQY